MKRKPDFLMQNVAGENLLVPLGAQVMKMNGLITLNATGAFIWELLAEDRSVDDLANAVADNFDVTPETARADVQAFVDEITKLGMLEKANHG